VARVSGKWGETSGEREVARKVGRAETC